MTEAEISSEIERLRKLPYTYVTRQDDDGSWFAQIKELRGCITVGANRDDALAMLDDALIAWLEGALEDGVAIPEPEEDRRFSGRFVIRVAHSMHRTLSERAEREGVSLNSLVVTALATFLGDRDTSTSSYQQTVVSFMSRNRLVASPCTLSEIAHMIAVPSGSELDAWFESAAAAANGTIGRDADIASFIASLQGADRSAA